MQSKTTSKILNLVLYQFPTKINTVKILMTVQSNDKTTKKVY